jgi:hypothetical protein
VRVEHLAHCFGYKQPSVARDEPFDRGQLEQPVYRRERATRSWRGIQHGGRPAHGPGRKEKFMLEESIEGNQRGN